MEQSNIVLETAIVETKKQISSNDFKFELPSKIRTNKDHLLAADATKYFNDRLKIIETNRKKLVQPLTDLSKEINSAFKVLSEPLDNVVGEIKDKLLEYTKFKIAEQAAYEEQQKLKNPGQNELVVDDKVAKIKSSEVSSNYLKKTINYRVKDTSLQSIVVIKKEGLEEWLKTHRFVLPDWIESYETESIVVRSK